MCPEHRTKPRQPRHRTCRGLHCGCVSLVCTSRSISCGYSCHYVKLRIFNHNNFIWLFPLCKPPPTLYHSQYVLLPRYQIAGYFFLHLQLSSLWADEPFTVGSHCWPDRRQPFIPAAPQSTGSVAVLRSSATKDCLFHLTQCSVECRSAPAVAPRTAAVILSVCISSVCAWAFSIFRIYHRTSLRQVIR